MYVRLCVMVCVSVVFLWMSLFHLKKQQTAEQPTVNCFDNFSKKNESRVDLYPSFEVCSP